MALPDTVTREKQQTRSKALFEISKEIMPDGVAGDGQYWAPFPIVMERANGARMWSVDGDEYLDFICGNGAIILGHRHPIIVDAVIDFMNYWPPNLTPNVYTIELAQMINRHIPSMQKLRFVPSATEAVHIALRVARAYTGRPKAARIEGGFHGQVDEALVSTWPHKGRRGARNHPVPQPSSAGLAPGTLENTILIPWNDPEAAVAIIEANADQLASVMIEPVIGVGGALPATQEFIDALREVTARNEIVFIIDETVTGYRFNVGGAQKLYDVTPDLTILGKVIGGGFPLAAFGGSNAVMSVVGRAGGKSLLTQAYQSGTLSGFALGCAAGAAVLRALEEYPVHEHIGRLGQRLRDGMTEISSVMDVSMQVTGIGPMFNAFFTDQPVKDVRDSNDVDPGKRIGTEVHNRLMQKGIRALRNHFSLTCYAHTDADVDQMLSALEDVLREMRTEGSV